MLHVENKHNVTAVATERLDILCSKQCCCKHSVQHMHFTQPYSSTLVIKTVEICQRCVTELKTDSYYCLKALCARLQETVAFQEHLYKCCHLSKNTEEEEPHGSGHPSHARCAECEGNDTVVLSKHIHGR